MAMLLSASASPAIAALSSSSSSTSSRLFRTPPCMISSNTQKHKIIGRPASFSPLRVAAPPTTPPTSESEQSSQTDQNRRQEEDEGVKDELGEEGSSSKFSWRDHWYPVSLVEDLDPGLPTPFQLLGRDLVLWNDRSTGKWVAFDDKCPHRLAPLSEGRIDEGGNLQCSYHGWSFDGCGSCVKIPQASPEGPEARAIKSPRACATRFPTMVSQGLLFVWPDENGWERANATKPPM